MNDIVACLMMRMLTLLYIFRIFIFTSTSKYIEGALQIPVICFGSVS